MHGKGHVRDEFANVFNKVIRGGVVMAQMANNEAKLGQTGTRHGSRTIEAKIRPARPVPGGAAGAFAPRARCSSPFTPAPPQSAATACIVAVAEIHEIVVAIGRQADRPQCPGGPPAGRDRARACNRPRALRLAWLRLKRASVASPARSPGSEIRTRKPRRSRASEAGLCHGTGLRRTSPPASIRPRSHCPACAFHEPRPNSASIWAAPAGRGAAHRLDRRAPPPWRRCSKACAQSCRCANGPARRNGIAPDRRPYRQCRDSGPAVRHHDSGRRDLRARDVRRAAARRSLDRLA